LSRQAKDGTRNSLTGVWFKSSMKQECSEPIILNLSAPVTFDMVQTREDMLVGGQRIANYSIDAWVDGAWCVATG
jgi:hypothetical protein